VILPSDQAAKIRQPHRHALDYHQPMSSNHTVLRRDVLTAAGTALTTSLFAGGRARMWDEKQWTSPQEAAKPYLRTEYRIPWMLEV